MDRRNFLKKTFIGAASAAFAPHILNRPAKSMNAAASVPRSEAVLVKGKSRFGNIMNVLEELGASIRDQIGSRQVVIKPNMVSTRRQLAASHVDELRAILEFLKPFYKKKVIIAESATLGTTWEGYKNYNYYSLADKYNVEFISLNEDEPYPMYIIDKNMRPLKIHIAKFLTNPDIYLISAAVLKCHNCVVATLALKNIVMGAPLIADKQYKAMVHQGTNTKGLNYNLFRIAQVVRPHLSIIDGFNAMEGNGPRKGTPVPTKIAIGSTDVITADRIAVECMGIDYKKIGYLQFCARANMGQDNLDMITVKGDRIENCMHKFRLHDNIEWQYSWMEDIEE